MTSENELRKIAAYEVEAACINTEIGDLKQDYPELDDYELCRVHHLIVNWPIPDMPPGDRDRCWWPKRGINYGHVRAVGGAIKIARGGPYVAARYTSLHLTPAEAEELASLLLAAAHHERNQE